MLLHGHASICIRSLTQPAHQHAGKRSAVGDFCVCQRRHAGNGELSDTVVSTRVPVEQQQPVTWRGGAAVVAVVARKGGYTRDA